MALLSLRNEVRQSLRQQRRQLSAVIRNNAAESVAKRLMNHPAILAGTHIGLYAPFDGEINTYPLMKLLWTRGKRLYLPHIHPFSAHQLLFLEHFPNGVLLSNRYGILTPPLNLSLVKPIQQLDVLFVPVVAFDRRGYRLGMGGGFYDRLLCQNASFRAIGIAYSQQEIPHIPNETWDIPLPEIITENETIACG